METPPDKNGISVIRFGEVENLPPPQDGVILIVSAMVAARCSERIDIVSPATGHKDCVRKDGFIVSVPHFVRTAAV